MRSLKNPRYHDLLKFAHAGVPTALRKYHFAWDFDAFTDQVEELARLEKVRQERKEKLKNERTNSKSDP